MWVDQTGMNQGSVVDCRVLWAARGRFFKISSIHLFCLWKAYFLSKKIFWHYSQSVNDSSILRANADRFLEYHQIAYLGKEMPIWNNYNHLRIAYVLI